MDSTTLNKVKVGQKALLKSIDGTALEIQLFELGLLPNTELYVSIIAPLGDPLIIRYNDVSLSIRKDDASKIRVTIQ